MHSAGKKYPINQRMNYSAKTITSTYKIILYKVDVI